MCVGGGGGQIGPKVGGGGANWAKSVGGWGGGPVRTTRSQDSFWGWVGGGGGVGAGCVFWRRRGIFAIGFPLLLTRNIHRPIYLPEK